MTEEEIEDCCAICRFYIEAEKHMDEDPGSLDGWGIDGFCRRYPPQYVLHPETILSLHVEVKEDGWCGEFKNWVTGTAT